jgi:hypothetical protein
MSTENAAMIPKDLVVTVALFFSFFLLAMLFQMLDYFMHGDVSIF